MDSAYFVLMQDDQSESMHSKGFVLNVKRGTGFIYGKKPVDGFCDRNSIDFIIRGHEVFHEGIRFFIGGKVVSVFSSSKYVGLNNSASALLVEGHHIRVVRIASETYSSEYTIRNL